MAEPEGKQCSTTGTRAEAPGGGTPEGAHDNKIQL